MKKLTSWTLAVLAIFVFNACKPSYESVPNDPLNARIYTLNNGLKVYMTVNKDEPRIQTYIAVRVGGKNDPAETTGLAHYFEHLMFKGTNHFGTVNYEDEKILLDQIEALFEVYRKTSDEAERKAIYKTIDSISYEASKLFVPNEYDKLMSAIGASGTNAYTGMDMTVYTEDIPANEIENWAKIQADRFGNAVIRGFHTELETVYEEKNMSLTNDTRKVYEKMLSILFPNHPYGTQTVLGTQEHLKNPSITNIKRYYETYYVPNNMAVCLSGDFDPDNMLKIIKKYFGSLQANPELPALEIKPEEPISSVISAEVVGNEAENVTVAWRAPGIGKKDYDVMIMASSIMNNGMAGLIDLDLIQQQKVLSAFGAYYNMADYSAYLMQARPKQGQSLDEVKELLLGEVAKLRAGDFDEDLLEATVNNFKLSLMKGFQSNANRADEFVTAFINGVEWADQVAMLDRIEKMTKQDIVDFANKYLSTEAYVVIYKRQGEDPNVKKIAKPEITPILTNRDTASLFLKEIQQSSVKPIEPVFLDYTKDLSQFTIDSKLPVLYIQNKENDLFELTYYFDMGTNSNKLLNTAFNYLNYLGTSEYTPEQIQSEFYKLACDYTISAGSERSYISLSGLGKNMSKALALLEKLLADPQINQEAFDNMIADMQKKRVDAKLNQSQCFSRLRVYAVYGPKSSVTNVLSSKELNRLKPEDLIAIIKNMTSYQHRIIYYGPLAQEAFQSELMAAHKVPAQMNMPLKNQEFPELLVKENKVYFAQYNAKQTYLSMYSNTGEHYDYTRQPIIDMYNEYFGGGMNAIVFQEMREARGLAYSAGATYVTPWKSARPYYMMTFIATQTDKVDAALQAFDEIINEMPESEKAFSLAKAGIDSRLRTQRITRSDILWNYIDALDLGLTEDSRKLLFEQLPQISLADVKAFQNEYIKGRSYAYAILADEADLDFKHLSETYGPVTKLSLEDIFGY